MTTGLRPLELCVLFALATLLLASVSRHEVRHDEAQAWNIARAADTPADIPHLSRHEGHTPVWYTVLWVAGRTGEVRTMSAVSAAMALVVAMLMLRDRPFGTTATLLALGGYYLVYEYSIIARPYVLTLLASAALATLYHRRPRRDPVIPAALCGFVALASAYSALLSCALFVVVAGRSIERSRLRRRLLLALPLWLVPLALSIWFVLTPLASSTFADQMLSGERASRFSLGTILITPVMPHVDRLPFDLGRLFSSPAGEAFRLLIAFCTIGAIGMRLRRDRVLLAAWVIAVLAISSGALYSSLVSERHLGHLWIAALTLCWIGAGRRDSPQRESPGRLDAFVSTGLAGVLAWHAVIGAAVTAYDLAKPLTPWKRMAASIDREVEEPYVLLASYMYDIGPVAAELDRPVYDIHCDCFTRYYDWSWEPKRPRDAPSSDAWCSLAADGDQVVVLTVSSQEYNTALRLVSSAQPSLQGNTRNPIRAWQLSESELRRCRTSS